MSKEDLTCKVGSVCKHKERKPKKPHYIPRPWGKPYNYKCFQCPFTCMEKSHLYNHMKYSLCKNSLSLLIESDWPYKKGNLLHAEQLRPLQQESRLRGTGREEVEPLLGQDGQPRIQQVTFVREPEVVEEHRIVGEGPGDETEENMLTKEASDQTDGSPSCTTKGSKQADFVITDVFSLEDQLLKARSVEVEAKLKHYKLSKTCLTGPSLLSEQWRLLSSSHRKAKSESTAPNSGSMPCYPPPPSFADCPEPPGLNLSVLGLSYQLNPGLFSYVNPTVPGAATAHTQMAQLPFLASTAQFMHPATSSLSHADRSLLPPRFYYPLLCEHSFGGAQMEARKGFKPGQSPPSNLDPNSPASFTPKVNLWKVPALRPNSNLGSPSPWASQPHVAGYRVAEEKTPCKDGKDWSLKSSPEVTLVREQGNKRTGAPLDMYEGPSEKKPTTGCTLDLLKNIHTFPSISMTTDKLPHHNSFKSTQHHSKPLEEWLKNVRSSPESLLGDMSPPLKAVERAGSHNLAKSRQKEQDPESAAELLSDLSKALQEYQDAERKISHLVKEDLPGQRYLWEHLCKIRNELSHIHQALEREARQNEGPLDLSIKKDQGMTGDGDSQCLEESIKGSVIGETEEEEDEDDEEEEGSKKEGKAESYESHRQSLDVLIKTNRTGLTDVSLETVVKTEVLSPSGLSLHATPAEALWPSRTTKCEADSSVLCPDGRSLVFTDFTPVAKRIRRPSSREHLGETLCSPSPLTASDS